jgi:hypothetical protein
VTATQLVVVAVAVFSASLIQVLSGFGFALLSVPLMTLAIPTKEAGVVTYADSTLAAGDSTVTVKLSTSRIITAVNAGVEVGPLHLWAEGGLQVGKKTELATPFELNDPNSGRFYGGAGVAIKF